MLQMTVQQTCIKWLYNKRVPNDYTTNVYQMTAQQTCNKWLHNKRKQMTIHLNMLYKRITWLYSRRTSTAYCIWSLIDSQSPISISLVSYQRNVVKEAWRTRFSIEIWEWRNDTPNAIGCTCIVMVCSELSCRLTRLPRPRRRGAGAVL